MRLIKDKILSIIPAKLKTALGRQELEKYKKSIAYSNLSFAQEGEDLILKRFLNNVEKGFYIDVGAHHPKRFSNTYLFYKKGWNGLNIDAMPGSMKLFREERPRDINLEVGISSAENVLTYYKFNEPALNTFSKEEADKKHGFLNYKIVDTVKVQTKPLSLVLDEYLPNGKQINFMTVDAEGFDLEVLESNNWDKYRPKYLLVENLGGFSVEEIRLKSPIAKFVLQRNYELIAKTFNTLFFKEI